jgi:SAM-dependent methyltransferase
MNTTDVVTTGQDFEYRGQMAATWDLFRGDTSNWEDRFLFLEVIRKYGQPALDVGCGTGRLLLDFLSQGMDVDGVDISPEMLALCHQKAAKLGLKPNTFQQRMESLSLPRKYQTIIVPSSSFQLLTDSAQAAQAMQSFYAHLLPGGVLAMPFMSIWNEGDPVEAEWKQTGEKVRPEDGAIVRRWSRAWYDLANQLEHTEDRYEITVNGEAITSEHHRRSPATRWYTREQVARLYREAGFADVQFFKFDAVIAPAGEADTTYLAVGIKP